MPSAKQPMTRTDHSGGVNVVSSPHQLAQNQVLRADNFILDEQGSLRVRDGITFSDEAPDATQRVLNLYNLTKEDQTIIPLVIRRKADGSQVLENRAGAWSLIGAFATPYDTPQMFAFNNEVIIPAGYESPRRTDGSSFTAITDLPGACWMLEHENSVWAWNTAQADTALDGRSSLRQSDVDNASSWPGSNQLFIARGDGQQGTGLGVFTIAEAGIAPLGILYAFKNFSTYQVNGVFGGGDAPAIVQVQTDMGCVAGKTIRFLPGLGLMRLTHRGFAVVNGLGDQLAPSFEFIRPYLFGHDDIRGINWSLAHLSVACQVQNPPLYICMCPTGAVPGLDRMFVFDMNRQAWTIITFPTTLSTVNLILEQFTLPYILGGSGEDGKVYRMFENKQFDDGRPIAWTVRFPPLGRPMERYFYDNCSLQLFPVRLGQVFTFKFALGPVIEGGVPVVVTKIVGVGASSTPMSPFQASVEAEVFCDFGQTGEVLWTEVSGSGYVGIRAVSWEVSQYKRVRPLRA